MKYNKNLIQWSKDRKKSAEDPDLVFRRRRTAILSELKRHDDPVAERYVYREIRREFSTHKDFLNMLQGLVKEKLVVTKQDKSTGQGTKYVLTRKGKTLVPF
tara:strand:- start:4839 stop:5144 length:306 start_codon:yes stop_codon:yes gene_type:complete